jgi:hypothetical protein
MWTICRRCFLNTTSDNSRLSTLEFQAASRPTNSCLHVVLLDQFLLEQLKLMAVNGRLISMHVRGCNLSILQTETPYRTSTRA